MNRVDIIEYYTREDVLKAIVKHSGHREVVGAFLDGRYDQRPNIVQYKSDIKSMIIRGVTSIHYSVEYWQNPMMLVSQDVYDENRIGWDYIVDIDSKLDINAAKIVALSVCTLFEEYGIEHYGIKFSGSRGFHICIPWPSIPHSINYTPTEKLYPKLPTIISLFIKQKLSSEVLKKLVKIYKAKNLNTTNPYDVVEIESNWGHRHMFRAPYSLNEKSWLVSLPLEADELENFVPSMAKPENIRIKDIFFLSKKNEAEDLIIDALDWYTKNRKEEKPKVKSRKTIKRKVPETFFPPCIAMILNGLEDGRKRSIFTLISFLRSVNWSWDEIWVKLEKWNQSNKPPLSKTILLSQFKWHQAQDSMLPANCDNELFYKSIGICEHCGSKNPVNYAYKKYKPSKAKFVCHVCTKEFKNLTSLNIHFSRAHGQV